MEWQNFLSDILDPPKYPKHSTNLFPLFFNLPDKFSFAYQAWKTEFYCKLVIVTFFSFFYISFHPHVSGHAKVASRSSRNAISFEPNQTEIISHDTLSKFCRCQEDRLADSRAEWRTRCAHESPELPSDTKWYLVPANDDVSSGEWRPRMWTL